MFEEAHLEKVLLASASVALGVACLVTLLVFLSVLPDCRGHIAPDFLTVFAIQCTIHLIVLFVSTVTVSYALAADDNIFMNSSVTNVPGYVILFCLSAVAAMQLYLNARRFIDYAFPYLFENLSSRKVSFVVLMFSFLFGANRFVKYVFADRTLNYRVDGLRWLYSTRSGEENFYVSATVGFATALVTTFYVVAVVFTLIKSASKETTAKERSELWRDIGWLTVCLLMDVIAYAGLLVYSHYAAVPSKFLHVPLKPAFHDGLIQSFALPMFTILSTFFTDEILRQALRYRIGILITGSPPVADPKIPLRLTRQNYQNLPGLLPLFLVKDSGDKPRSFSAAGL